MEPFDYQNIWIKNRDFSRIYHVLKLKNGPESWQKRLAFGCSTYSISCMEHSLVSDKLPIKGIPLRTVYSTCSVAAPFWIEFFYGKKCDIIPLTLLNLLIILTWWLRHWWLLRPFMSFWDIFVKICEFFLLSISSKSWSCFAKNKAYYLFSSSSHRT